MKKIVTAVLLLTAILSAEKIRVSYSFDEPVIQSRDGMQSVSIKGCINYGKEGEPSLPYLSSTLLLPPGEEIQSLSVVNAVYGTVKEDVKIRPAGKKIPLSLTAKQEVTTPSPQIYNSNTAYPLREVSNQTTAFLAGHSIGSFTICPVKYQPAVNRAEFLKSITVEIETAPTAKAAKALSLLSNSPETKSRVASMVENQTAAGRYNIYRDGAKTEQFDILLITSNALKPAFDNFVQYKASVGYLVKTVTVEEIVTGFTGADKQEKIRNCVKQYYTQNGISAVILGGDADTNNPSQNIIPTRGFYANPGSDDYADSNIPSDMYYACLDGNWNNNNNDKFGEDGEEDFLAEVLVGRICADNATEVTNFTSKIIKYQKQPVVADIGKALFLGEKLWDDPAPNGTYAAPYMNELITGASTCGYTTVGVNANPNIQVKTLYELDFNWQPSHVFSEFNTNGVNLLNHLGHSNTDYNMKMNSSQITTTNFQNNGVNRGYVIAYSQGCYNGSLDNRGTSPSDYSSTDCFAELITCLSTAEVASVANSRYGWGEQGSTNGASQYFHRQYIDAIFGENLTLIGKANQDSKEDNISFITQDGTKKWVCYETNLFGDPTMDIWTNAPVNMTPSFAQGVPLGAPSIEVSALPAGARVGIMQNNTLIGRAVAGSNGIAMVAFINPISSTEPLSISVTAHDKNQFNSSIVVITNEPYVIPKLLTIGDDSGNSNGQADLAENIKLGLNLENIGVGTADAIKAVISTSSSKMTITDNNELYGNIGEGMTMVRPLAFTVNLTDSITDQYSMPVKLEIFSNNILKWTNNLSFTVNAPNPVLNNCVINDAASNNNSIIDPDETVGLKFDYLNNGHFQLNNGTLTLSCSNPSVQLLQSSSATEALAINAAGFKEFQVKATGITTGTEVVFTLNWNAGAYHLTKTFSTVIGVTENFESNSFTANPWEFSGNSNWTIDGTVAFNGTKSAKSGAISHNQSTALKVKAYVNNNGFIGYYKKISSEPGYDFLSFFIDNQEMEKLAGELPWSKSEYPITTGEHILKWEYEKDVMEIGGSDCAWIDFIILQGGTLTSIEDNSNLPLVNELYKNYPNPFNPSTIIQFALTQKMNIKLSVYDVAGRQVATLANGEFNAGKHNLEFNGFRLSSGIYFYQLEANGQLIGRNKMMMLK